MNNWFECKVRYSTVDQNSGKDKVVTEPYLLDAVTFTDAETRMTKEATEMISGDFEIKAIKRESISDIFTYEDSDIWFKGRVKFESVDENSGKVKMVTQTMLVTASDVKQAHERIEENLKDMIIPYEIVGVVQSPIVEVFPYSPSPEIPENFKPME